LIQKTSKSRRAGIVFPSEHYVYRLGYFLFLLIYIRAFTKIT